MDKEIILDKIQQTDLYCIVDTDGKFLNTGMKNKKSFNDSFKDARIYTRLSTARQNVTSYRNHGSKQLTILKLSITDIEEIDDSAHIKKSIKEKKSREIKRKIRILSNTLERTIAKKLAVFNTKSLDEEIEKLKATILDLKNQLNQL